MVSRAYTIGMIYHWQYCPWSLAEVEFVRFLQCKIPLPSSFPYCTLWEQIIRLRAGGYALSPLAGSVCVIHLEFFYMRRLFFSHLYQYVLMNVYLIFWIIIQYYFILSFEAFQLQLSGALSAGSCAPLPFISVILYLVLSTYLFMALQADKPL